MADTGFFKGWLGPFKLVRRYASRKQESGSGVEGRVYEAHNAACGVLLLSSGLLVWEARREMASPPVAHGVAVQAVAESPAPTLVDMANQTSIAYSLPEKPFSDQAKAPCKPSQGEVEIHGGCWVELAKRPPCYENQAEYGGKCYLPVSARSRDKKREPQSLQP